MYSVFIANAVAHIPSITLQVRPHCPRRLRFTSLRRNRASELLRAEIRREGVRFLRDNQVHQSADEEPLEADAGTEPEPKREPDHEPQCKADVTDAGTESDPERNAVARTVPESNTEPERAAVGRTDKEAEPESDRGAEREPVDAPNAKADARDESNGRAHERADPRARADRRAHGNAVDVADNRADIGAVVGPECEPQRCADAAPVGVAINVSNRGTERRAERVPDRESKHAPVLDTDNVAHGALEVQQERQRRVPAAKEEVRSAVLSTGFS